MSSSTLSDSPEWTRRQFFFALAAAGVAAGLALPKGVRAEESEPVGKLRIVFRDNDGRIIHIVVPDCHYNSGEGEQPASPLMWDRVEARFQASDIWGARSAAVCIPNYADIELGLNIPNMTQGDSAQLSFSVRPK